MRLFTWLRSLKPVDMFFNWLGGDPEETVSASMGRMRKNDHSRFAEEVCDVLDAIEKDHCADSFDAGAHPTPAEAADRILSNARK